MLDVCIVSTDRKGIVISFWPVVETNITYIFMSLSHALYFPHHSRWNMESKRASKLGIEILEMLVTRPQQLFQLPDVQRQSLVAGLKGKLCICVFDFFTIDYNLLATVLPFLEVSSSGTSKFMAFFLRMTLSSPVLCPVISLK